MNKDQVSDKRLAYSVMILSTFFGAGSVAMLATVPLGSWSIIRLAQEWPVAGVLAWDTVLSLAFFFQHSGMVRRGFRDLYVGRIVPPRYDSAVYSISSGIVLTAVVLFWQPVDDPHLLIFDASVGNPLFFTLAKIISVLAMGLFLWGVFALGEFDPLGLAPIRNFLGGGKKPVRPSALAIVGPYRWVRHPLYLSVIMLIWFEPKLTPDRLLFNALWTAWIWIATCLEERDLRRDFGAAYERYQRSVPMLIPWRRPAAKAWYSD
jgi:protein-S-isoprenylcysteine O-methyltransferase Ste14